MSQHDEIYRGVPEFTRQHDHRLERQRAEYQQQRAEIRQSQQPQPAPALPPLAQPFVPEAPRRPLTEEEKKKADERARRMKEQWEEHCQQEADNTFTTITAIVVAGLVIWADVKSETDAAWYAHIIIVALPTITSVLALWACQELRGKHARQCNGRCSEQS